MPKIISPAEAREAITTTLTEENISEADAGNMAEGIFGGLLIGYQMDMSSFLAVHGNRLPHLTRLALTATGHEVAPRPGAMPTNI